MSEGYLYVAYDNAHIGEAVESARSLRNVDSNADITLICNQAPKENIFNKTIVRSPWHPRGLAGKVDAIGEFVYDKTLYLDTDLWFVENPRSLFQHLNSYDICITPDPAELEIPETGLVPYNTGLVGYRKNSKTKRLFEYFRWNYYQFPDSFIKYHPDRKRKTDQPYFMLALQKSECTTLVLDTTWNARYRFNTSFMGKVKIIHGPVPSIGWKELAKQMNRYYGNRCWKGYK